MLAIKQKAAGLTATSKNNRQTGIYRNRSPKSSITDEILAGLLFGLQYPHLSLPERATVLDVIDRLLRLKIDLKQGKGVCCGF